MILLTVSFSMMLYPLHILNLNAIQVMGRSDLTLRINIIKNLLMVFPIAVGILFNIYWMLVADVIRGYICYYLNAYYSKYVINYSVWEQVCDVYPSIKVALLVALPLYGLSFLPLYPILGLAIQIVCGSLFLLFLCEKYKYPEYLELKGIVFKVIKR